MEPIRPFFLDLSDRDIDRFVEGSRAVLKSGMLILGDNTEAFERRFAERVGTRHAVATSSGTAALEIMLRIKDVKGKCVLVPTNTNFATAAAVLHAGGTVRYLDMDRRTFAPTLAMVEQSLETTEEEVAGVLWVHIGGVISPEFPEVVALCRRRGLFCLEDAAHAHGSRLGGVEAGNLADGAAFSFFPTKVMTTFEGGMITTNDAGEADLARSFRNQGKRGTKFGGLHHDLGNSHRITEVGALLGLIFLDKLDAMLARRQAAYDGITAIFEANGIDHVSTRHMDAASQYKLIVLPPEPCDPAVVKQALSDQGVIAGGGVYEIPCHRQPVFEGLCPAGYFPVADTWCPRHLCPPLTSGLSPEDARRVGHAVVRAIAAAASRAEPRAGARS